MSKSIIQFSSVQSLSCVQFFATPWITACQASLSITNSRSLLKLNSIKSVMPSSHLILCHPLLLLPPIPTSIRVFSNESTLRMRWPKYWSIIIREYFVSMCMRVSVSVCLHAHAGLAAQSEGCAAISPNLLKYLQKKETDDSLKTKERHHWINNTFQEA